MSWTVLIHPGAVRDLKALKRRNPEALKTFDQIIRGLAKNPMPQGAAALSGAPRHYRLRRGDFRIVWELQQRRLVVLVVVVGHRSEVYDILKRRRG